MNSRAKTTIILAVVAVAVVMSVALLMTFGGSAPAKYATPTVWSQPMSNMQSMKIIDLTGDGQNDLFLQNETSFKIVTADGKELQAENFNTPLATSMGDVNGDGVEDVIVFAPIERQTDGGRLQPERTVVEQPDRAGRATGPRRRGAFS